MIVKTGNLIPQYDKSNFIAANASCVGDVKLGKNSSLWYNATARGDIAPVLIGTNTNIQDGAVIHVDHDLPAILGDNITVGHQANVHGATIEDNCIIGIGAIVLSGAIIKKNSIVGAGAVVTPGKEFPEGSLIIGSPARSIRKLTAEEVEKITENAALYCHLAEQAKASEIIE